MPEAPVSRLDPAASDAPFRALADNLPQLAWMARPDGWIVWFNRRWFEYTGTTLADMQGWGWTAVHHPDHLDGVLDTYRQRVEQGEPWEDTFPLRGADGEYRWFLSRANPVRDDAGRVILWVGTNTDITRRVTAETALREREAELARVQRIGRVGGFEIDLAHGGFRNRRSPEYLRLHALPPDATTEPHDGWVRRLHPEDRARVEQHFLATVAGPALDYAAEYRILLPGGGLRWIAAVAEIERDATGRPLRMIGAHLDITERKIAETRQALLAREVDHRARNVLAVVQSVLRLTRAADLPGYRLAVEGRIAALARAHSLLAEARWDHAGLREVLETELGAYQDGSRVTLAGPMLRLGPNAVQPLAMVAHELSSNAARHGALASAEGRVAVTWDLDAEGVWLRLFWAETGAAGLAPPAGTGFGTRVIEATVRDQLGGEITMDWAPDGLRCTLRLPAPRVLSLPTPA